MSVRWYDGLENYGTVDSANLLAFWSAVTRLEVVATGDIRTGNYCWMSDTSADYAARRSLGGDFEKVGFALGHYMRALPTNNGKSVLMQFRNSDSRSHISIQITPLGRLRIIGAGLDKLSSSPSGYLAESTKELSSGTWYFISAVVEIGGSGSVSVRVNGREFVTYSGNTDLAPAGAASIAEIAMGQFDGSGGSSWGSNERRLDDMVAQVLTDAPGDSVDHLSDLPGVFYLPPVADGDFSDFSLTSGSDGYSLINEISPDDDLNYIFSPTVNDESSFVPQSLPADVISILALAPTVRSRKSSTGVGSIALGVYESSTKTYAPDRADSEAYTGKLDIFELNPTTASAWDPLTLPQMIVKRTE